MTDRRTPAGLMKLVSHILDIFARCELDPDVEPQFRSGIEPDIWFNIVRKRGEKDTVLTDLDFKNIEKGLKAVGLNCTYVVRRKLNPTDMIFKVYGFAKECQHCNQVGQVYEIYDGMDGDCAVCQGFGFRNDQAVNFLKRLKQEELQEHLVFQEKEFKLAKIRTQVFNSTLAEMFALTEQGEERYIALDLDSEQRQFILRRVK